MIIYIYDYAKLFFVVGPKGKQYKSLRGPIRFRIYNIYIYIYIYIYALDYSRQLYFF